MTNNSILSIPVRDRLLLAYACTEWSGALTHLRALVQVGSRVPDDVMYQVSEELIRFTALWCDVHDNTTWSVEEAVDHARAWLAEHIEELDALLAEGETSG